MKRFWEIDALRGIAVVLMVLFNYLFALRFLNVYVLDAGWAFWWLFPRVIAGVFILLVGVSLSISYDKKRKYNHFFKRGLMIFGMGLLATLTTWLYLGRGFVVFGILHLIGLSIMLAPLFFRFGKRNLALGFVLFVFGLYLNSLTGSYWLVWLGVTPTDFYTVDYFPLLPWFGLVLTGFGIGSDLYRNGKRTFKIKEMSLRPLQWLGRHSLIIYVVHQPLLIIALTLLGLI